MRAGDPQLAKSSKTWTTDNAPWSGEVQRSIPELAAGNAPQFVQQASDNGLQNTVSAKLSQEGPLSTEFEGLARMTGQFNNGYYGANPQMSRGWKPGR